MQLGHRQIGTVGSGKVSRKGAQNTQRKVSAYSTDHVQKILFIVIRL